MLKVIYSYSFFILLNEIAIIVINLYIESLHIVVFTIFNTISFINNLIIIYEDTDEVQEIIT